MTKFYAHLDQGGEGCDYTIGCGELLVSLKSNTRDSAIEEIKSWFVGQEAKYSSEERRVVHARLIATSYEEEIDLSAWNAENERRIKNAENTFREQAERAELERLKIKYKDDK